jgi:hypothetical protein
MLSCWREDRTPGPRQFGACEGGVARAQLEVAMAGRGTGAQAAHHG